MRLKKHILLLGIGVSVAVLMGIGFQKSAGDKENVQAPPPKQGEKARKVPPPKTLKQPCRVRDHRSEVSEKAWKRLEEFADPCG